MSIEDLKKIGKLSKEDTLAKIRSGEIVIPPKGKDRDEFLAFVDKPIEERERVLNPVVPPELKKEEKTPPVVPPKEGDKGTPSPSETWWKKLGYESEAKAEEAHKNLIDLSSRQQQTIDRLNATGGKQGQELKRLKEEHDKTVKALQDSKPVVKIEKPVRPKRPDVSKFEDGILDEKYPAALTTYETQLESYEEQREAYLTQNLIQTLKPAEVSPAPVDNAPWERLWNNEIPEFQKKHGLVTTIPIKQISDAYVALSGTDQTHKTVADAFLKTVPPADLEAYNKVRVAVETAYDFSSGIPEPKYKTIEGALVDNDLIGEGKLFNAVKPVKLSAAEETAARERERLKQGQSQSAIPASSLAGNDTNTLDVTTIGEKQKRLKELNDKYNIALNGGIEPRDQFEASTEYQEYLNLRKALGMRQPPRR